jgi:hypothetical protein
MRPFKKIIVAVLVGLVVSTPAYAYLDPNAGGLFFQIVTPILALAAAAIAFAGQKIRHGWSSLYHALKGLLNRAKAPGRDLD